MRRQGPRPDADVGVWLIGGALALITVLAWLATVRQGLAMASMQSMAAGMSMPAREGLFSLEGAAGYLLAWGVMMAAMMLPSAAPMILLYGAIHRPARDAGRREVAVALFAFVYLLAWLAFGVPIYLANLAIDAATTSRPAVAGMLAYAVALVLVVAGVFQLTPLKHRCLRACQTPMTFLMTHWQGGYLGSVKLALAHAAYCVGCCWALMVVLVAAGAMALHWVLLVATVVFAEKLLPGSRWTVPIVGGALIFLGLLVALVPDLTSTLRAAW